MTDVTHVFRSFAHMLAVEGHKGKLVLGLISGHTVVAMQVCGLVLPL